MDPYHGITQQPTNNGDVINQHCVQSMGIKWSLVTTLEIVIMELLMRAENGPG